MIMKCLVWFWITLRKLAPYLIFLGFGILCWRWFSFSNQAQADLAEPIINGVIAGVVTSLLILIFSVVWRSNITPWLENLLYKDTKIEGVWNGVLVPFIGIEEIDKRRINIAFGVVERRRRRRKSPSEEPDEKNDTNKSLSVAASAQEKEGERDIEAELIIKGAPDVENGENQDELIDRKFFF
ncbi:hypothetical protein MSP8886_02216 [Marinomonas spartinae]|nr:hypothetical protein [Marinomonas spartinae]SBS31720.1 hypothetical protein MSP8886_02216 [Marinomonas spartinae]